ncbi:hypothetical protein, partial [Desulfuromonas sp. TF]|uniref:hypothetical protein n=1 Tax=Desulfuromonas sp. TF TaxID=1232410 RepID=UPI001D038FB9
GRPFSAYSFRPVKEYVAVGGRNPRVLQLISEFFFDSLYGSIVISGFILKLGDWDEIQRGKTEFEPPLLLLPAGRFFVW